MIVPFIVMLCRLSEATILGDLTEVPVPTRFLFFLLGPAVSHHHNQSTILS